MTTVAVGSTSPPFPLRQPSVAGGVFRAEAAWLATGLPVHVFRLAGIYGPGRGPFRKVLDGTARRVIKPGPGIQQDSRG